jgi:trimeric autotransporter adhesin
VRGLVIESFGGSAIVIQSPGYDTVQGNYLGTDISGTQVPYIGSDGVSVSGSNNLIGGTGAGDGNLISGNVTDIYLNGSNNVVEGNTIGTALTGSRALRNGGGVVVTSSASNNTIGGTDRNARNLISGNFHGVQIDGDSNVFQGNYVGTDASGEHAIPNGSTCYYGTSPALLVTGNNNLIGGAAPGAGNLISGNLGYGLAIGTYCVQHS